MKVKNSAILVVVIILLIGAYLVLFGKETWLGFYYPNSGNLYKYIQSSNFDSLDECRSWVNSQVTIYNPSGSGYDYECGKNCKFDKNAEIYVCKETVK